MLNVAWTYGQNLAWIAVKSLKTRTPGTRADRSPDEEETPDVPFSPAWWSQVGGWGSTWRPGGEVPA